MGKYLPKIKERILPEHKENRMEIVTELEEESSRMLQTVTKTVEDMPPYYADLILEKQTKELDAEVTGIIDSYKRATSNIWKSYLKSSDVSDELGARWRDLKKSRRRKTIPAAPANAVIDLEESSSNHFAQGLNIYKLLLICFIGSFVGVVTELIWCLIRHGYFESRAGLVYGPFNLLYGVAAVALTATLYPYRNRGRWVSFLGGMFVGSFVEYVCSWAQELILGSRSWDYSMVPFNINGRICLLYSVFWGYLAVMWIKSLYPRVAKWILKIPNRVGIFLTWAFFVFFVINAAVSAVSVFRWSQRVDGNASENAFWEIVDERFPDERMERLFPNMRFGSND